MISSQLHIFNRNTKDVDGVHNALRASWRIVDNRWVLVEVRCMAALINLCRDGQFGEVVKLLDQHKPLRVSYERLLDVSAT